VLERYQRVKTLIFDDDLFTVDADYLERFLAFYRAEFDLPFVVNAHVKVFDERVAKMLAESGCRIVKFGLESGSPRVRSEVMARRMTNDDIVRAFAVARAAGLHTSAFVMFGLPTETPEEMMETMELLARARPGRFRWALFFPYPNTDAHDLAVESGQIDRERMRTLPNFTAASCLDFGPETNLLLEKIAKVMPWLVNARTDWPAADLFKEIEGTVLALDAEAWRRVAPRMPTLERQVSEVLTGAGMDHYAIRYNTFTAVESSYFLAEEAEGRKGGENGG
jgi:hypothetical protein